MHVAVDSFAHLLLLLTLTLLDHAHGQTDLIGGGCRLSRGYNGQCQLIHQCQSVYDDLLSDRRPEVVCGYRGSTPIVCCPIVSAPAAFTTSQPTTTTTTTTINPSTVDRPAVRMCKLYARSAYGLVRSPTLIGGDKPLVNVSFFPIAQKMILGGTKAEPKEFPHMAAIGYNSGSKIRWGCGGTLVSEKFVLTAAHCTVSLQWGNAQWVRVGDLNLQRTNDVAKPQDRRIIERIRYPYYHRPSQYYDIALLRLQLPVIFNAYVRPACLDVRGYHPAGEKVAATGWGIVDWQDEAGPDHLQKVMLPIVDYSSCAKFYTHDKSRLPNGINSRVQICAGGNGNDTCQGDSGGPITIYSTIVPHMHEIIGVTSFGQLCGSVSPGIYSRVFYYLTWIESVVWPSSALKKTAPKMEEILVFI